MSIRKSGGYRKLASFQTDPSDPTDRIPNCPQCGKAMALRTAKQGQNAGQQFWGCNGYPDCKGTSKV